MRTFTVSESVVTPGIEVNSLPYWKVVLGAGGHKRSTWIALGKRDVDEIIKEKENIMNSENIVMNTEGKNIFGIKGKIFQAGIIALKNNEGVPTGNHLIVKERGNDDRVLIVWRVSSGFRGSVNIEGGQEVKIVAFDKAWHSGQGSLGETAECMAILKPGQRLYATITGRRVEEPRAILVYDGKEIKITFGKEDLETVLSDEQPQGEYV